MAAAIAPIAMGVGTLMAADQANKQHNEAKKNNKAQRDVAKRAMEISDIIKGIADTASADGAFDADTQIKALEKDTARYEAEDMANAAGAMRIAGNQPGDTGTSNMLQNIKLQYRKTLDNARLAIRRAGVFDKINAYQMAVAGGGLQTAGSIYGQQAQQAQQNMPQIGSFIGSLMPFLNKPNAGGASGGFTTGGSDAAGGALTPPVRW